VTILAFSETTILSTREPAYGARVVGQVIVVPSGRLDKVSMYLEPVIGDPIAAQSIDVIVETYALDVNNIPTGAPLSYDSKLLSSMTSRGVYNFHAGTLAHTMVGVTLRAPAGSGDNYVAWRFVSSSGGEPALISEDGGTSWTKDTTKKMAFLAYSLSFLPDSTPGVIDAATQTATLQPGQDVTIEDDSAAQWSLGTLDRAAIDGDTVVIDFGDYAITLVVDNSGSMTWNDSDGLRFDFLEAFIDDIEAGLAPHHSSSQATYSIIKFYGRQVGRLSLNMESGSSTAIPVGARLLRKQGAPITGPTDGVVLFEGLAEGYSDSTVSSGNDYYYAIYSYDSAGNFSSGAMTMVTPQTFKYPIGAGGFSATPTVVDVTLPDLLVCTPVTPAPAGDYDIGKRYVALKWYDPTTSDPTLEYDGFYVVRRTDRYAESIFDGTPMKASSYGGYDTLVPDVAPSAIVKGTGTYQYRDFHDLTAAPTEYLSPILGLKYYYTIFTYKSGAGGACDPSNAAKASAAIPLVTRFWEQEDVFNDPASYCFDVTPPAPPTASVVIGSEELEIIWAAGDPTSVRYQLYYDPLKSPEAKISPLGSTTISGTLLYDGEGTSYVHRNLENDQPHFYLLVALDQLANVSPVLTFSASPTEIDPSSDSVPPEPASDFRARIAGSSKIVLSWILPLSNTRSLSLWFGETATANLVVTFSDLNTRTSIATLEFDELDRNVTPQEGDVVEASEAIDFASIPQSETNVLVAAVSMSPSMFLLNQIESANISFRGALRVKEAATGRLYSEILTTEAKVKFTNPFYVSVLTDPTQQVHRTSWSLACSLDDSPKQEIEVFPGVYVRTGEALNLQIEAKYRDVYIPDALPVKVRILDPETGEPSTRITLPETNSNGVAILSVTPVEDEVLDRTGNPSGTKKTRSLLSFVIPPQDFPGDFLVEASAEYNGYQMASTTEVHFESSLNIDIQSEAFSPDGVDIKEQRAFVYYGDPSSGPRTPVPDLSVLNWELVPIQTLHPRSLYSTDTVTGTGIKSFVRSGVARNVFFGPASNVEPPRSPTCTDGELWALKCTAKIAGLEKVEYSIIELNPFEPPPLLNRVFLKVEGGFNTAELMADGSAEATFVVIAKPELDGDPLDPQSGAYFRDRIVSSGGTVPSLDDGNLVTLYVTKRHGLVSPYSTTVYTNIATTGSPMMAQARIEGGIAEFKIKVNARVAGIAPDPPLSTEYSNLIYDQELGWPLSPEVFAIVASIPIEVGGKQIVFTGGGNSLTSSTPPVFLGLIEPLAPGSITGS